MTGSDLEYKKAFKIFDQNGDGKITVDELENVMKSLGQEPTKLELKLLMKEADTDGNIFKYPLFLP